MRIVVKDMLLRASESDGKIQQDLCNSTQAILFLGTPHRGSDYTDIGETIRHIVSTAGFDTANQNIRALEIDSGLLENCDERFQKLRTRHKFEIHTFQEAHGMKGTSIFNLNEKVVRDFSSSFPLESSKVTINANHLTMCKYSSRDDDGYGKIVRKLQGPCNQTKTLCEAKEKERVEKLDEGKQPCLDTLFFSEMNYRQLEIENARVNSCTWILRHNGYAEWVKARRGLLWIKGKPGSGKSTLMKKIFNLLDEDADYIRLAFFFHRRGTSLQQTQIGMFRTLLHQLLKRVPSAGAVLLSLYEEKKRLGRFGMDWDWSAAELRQIFKSALLVAAMDHTIRIFVDALDEAGEEPARSVVSYLCELNNMLPPEAATSICFSCRHHPIVTTNHGFQICVEDENDQDIKAYVLSELEEKILSQDEVLTRDEDLSVLGDDISSKASGVFLWAALIVPMVVRQYNEGESLETVQETLRKVPSDLGEVYQDILTNIVNPEDKERRLHLMQWICLAVRPLSLTELRFAMASDDSSIYTSQYSCQESKGFIKDGIQMKKRIIGLSGGLAEVKHHNSVDTVQFIHQSVNDFLVTGGFRCLDPTPPRDLIGLGHHRLSKSCINYLKLGESLHRGRTWDSRTSVPELPFIDYATRSWFLHAGDAESRGISQQELVQQFKSPQQVFAIWVKIYRAIDKYSDRCPELGSTLLHTAASSNLQSVVRTLLQNGISTEEEDSSGNRALHYAVRWGHEELSRILLEAHAEIGAKNRAENTPLEKAAANGHKRVVKLLLERGANVNERTGDSGDALQAAAQKGSATLVKTLLESEAKVNAQGGHYGNALQAASRDGNVQTVQLLLDKGAQINAQGGYYGNALQAASLSGHAQTVQLLLDKGAQINAQGGCYGSALQAASRYGCEQTVQLLLDKGAEVNARGGYYDSALQAASLSGREQIVLMLLDKGAEVDAQGGHYGNALQAASFNGHERTAQLLLDKGAHINAQGGHFGSALQAASFNGHERTVQLLLDRGAKVDAHGGRYDNALQAASVNGHAQIVELLKSALRSQ
ncbi:hypothetical protein GP486_005765 [Trichoglossum hirsutum]|uniref:Nephrocystin 3-like N-terminal domain-containing protein n=1 Tax=Trichoglossum hirsutum TaxID=265104 RepID=A0A9P8L8L5_9PEZI|nr:hypothetical protein GP486_005765 [Trichoglossum hirsutum]